MQENAQPPIPESATLLAADPELIRLAKRTPAMSLRPRALRLSRFVADRMQRRVQGELASGVRKSDHIAGASVEVRVYRPSITEATSDDSLPVLVWMHGGGFVMGDHREDTTCSQFVSELGIAVVSVGYRLAPEHPFPAALNDLWTAITWLRSEGAAMGLDTERMAVGGSSAGGGLAAALAQRAHDDGIEIRGQILVYSMLDDRTAVRTDFGRRDHKGWTNGSNYTGWSSYLGTEPGSPTALPYAVPARREDLAGLAPAWIGVGTLDVFLDEDRAYADRLRAAGVWCDLVIVDEAIHGFDILAADAESSRAFLASQVSFLRDVLGA